MLFSQGELLVDIHGLVLGALFLLAYSGGLAGLIGLRTEWETERGLKAQYAFLLVRGFQRRCTSARDRL